MAHTKQTPRNPKIDRPTAAVGSDVQLREEFLQNQHQRK